MLQWGLSKLYLICFGASISAPMRLWPHRSSFQIILNPYRVDSCTMGDHNLAYCWVHTVIPWVPSCPSPWSNHYGALPINGFDALVYINKKILLEHGNRTWSLQALWYNMKPLCFQVFNSLGVKAKYGYAIQLGTISREGKSSNRCKSCSRF